MRLVIQQCTSARLKLPCGDAATISRGMVVFVCFRQGTARADAERAAETTCHLKLCEDVGEEREGGRRRVSVLESGGEVLVVPQATLGGKLKGKALQYHGNVGKEEGEELYGAFCRTVAARMEDGSKVKSGVYGARQVLSTETNGPYTHVLEL